MARTAPQIVGFAGEVDRETLGRTDLDLYPSLAETMENVSLTSSGKMSLAPGSKYVGLAPSNDLAILRPWVFAIDQSYMVTFTDEALHLIDDSGFVQLDGAAATVGAFADESTSIPTGGGPPPEGGGDIPPGPTCEWIEYGEGGGGYWLCL